MKKNSNIIYKFLIIVVFMLASLFIGSPAVFANGEKEITAVNAEAVAVDSSNAQITNNGWTESSGNYSLSISESSEKNVSLEIKIVGRFLFSFDYKVSRGKLVVSYNGNNILDASGGIFSSDEGSKSFTLENEGENQITFTATSTGSKWTGYKAESSITNLKMEAISTDFASGIGSSADPYIIEDEEQLQKVADYPTATFKLNNDINLTKTFTPIGSVTTPFSGTFLGNDKKISGLTITGGEYRGLFGYVNKGAISNLFVDNFKFNAIGQHTGFLVGYAKGGTTISNVCITNSTMTSKTCNLGGIVGTSDSKTGVSLSNCSVQGSIYTTGKGNIGGFISAGGTFTDCETLIDITGVQQVGGFVGGHDVDSAFTNCVMKGSVSLIGEHSNNYPYWGLLNGYGAWNSYNLSNSGQEVICEFETTDSVDEIYIFNSNITPTGLKVDTIKDLGNNKYSFTQFVELSETYVGSVTNGSALTSETAINGILGNYGGFTIRFKMQNGTYKYISTLDRANARFISNLTTNLDELTSYEDNFSSIEINTSIGTLTHSTSGGVSIGGSAKIYTANDFEHLSWVINGGIPTVFAGSKSYNMRSMATISIQLMADIDLTEKRYLSTDSSFVLNTIGNSESGEIINNFYGFGHTEMLPYRGSIYGMDAEGTDVNRSINVNMNYPNAYLLGIINCATDKSSIIYLKNITVNGTIIGRNRVGIVAMYDHHNRTGGFTFYKVVNNATITAQTQVAGILAEAQGAKSSYGFFDSSPIITIEGCVNNGIITATANGGRAGGLIGCAGWYPTYATFTIKNSINNGRIVANNGYAGGLVAHARANITIDGTVINSGAVVGKTYNYYLAYKVVEEDGTTYSLSKASQAILKTEYKLDFKISGLQYTLNATGTTLENTNITTEGNGLVTVALLDTETLSGVQLSVNVSHLKNPLNITLNPNTMLTEVSVPLSITFIVNDYELESSNKTWDIKATITFNDKDDETITLTPNIDENTLNNTNQLVFKNVTFSHSFYKVDETKTLSRITSGVEAYVTKAKALLDAKTGDDFLTLGTAAKTAHDTILAELTNIDIDNVTRFNNFISNAITNNQNLNVSNDVLKAYYAVIVTTTNLENLQNITVSYEKLAANSNIVKTISFTMLDGASKEQQITYTFVKDSNKIKTRNTDNLIYTVSTTNGVRFTVGEGENQKTTYLYNEDIDITVTKLTLEVSFTEQTEEIVYDGTEKNLEFTLTNVVSGDDVVASLLYNRNVSAINAGTYEVSLDGTLTGSDADYYVVPNTTATLTITPLTVELVKTSEDSFVFENIAQAPTFRVDNNYIGNSYQILTNDYTVTYSGSNYEASALAPVNAGSYTVNVVLKDNFQFDEQGTRTGSIAFTISKAKITDITMQGSYVYSKGQPEFVYTNYAGLITNETITVSDYSVIFVSDPTLLVTTFDVGSYTLYIKEITADNYELAEELTKDFTITAREIAITIDNKTSIYGEAIDLENLSYTVTSELKVCEGDNLGLVAEESTVAALAGRPTVQDYDLEAEATNTNYAVTVTKGTYSITPKEITIVYVENDFTYNGANQFDSIKNPTINTPVTGDEEYFIFQLAENKTEFKDFGNYVLELVSNNYIETNYTILSETSKDYNIKKLEVNITINDLTKTYNETIYQSDFEINDIESAIPDDLANVAELIYTIDENAEIGVLDVGTYTINISFAAKTLYNNYNFIVDTATLTIEKRDTELESTDVVKFYDIQSVSLVAKLYGADGFEIENPTLTYTYYKNDSTTAEANSFAKDVGSYKVVVNFGGDKNNNSCSAEYSVTIKESVITIDDSALTVIYNGQNYVPSYTYKINGEETTIDLEEKAGLTYSLLDSGKNPEDSIKNAGDYFIKFSITDANFKFEENKEEFAFSINKAKITDITMQGSYVYSKGQPEFVYTNFAGLITNETIIVSDYAIKKDVVTPTTFDVGSYTLYIKEITADNYELAEELTKDFTITAREIAITIDNKTSIYGEAIDLENLSYTVTSELKVCEGDDLGIVAKESTVAALAGRPTVQDYDLEAEATNANYAVTVTKGIYSITQRKVTIEYVEDNFTYNGEDQLSSIINPTIDNIAEGEESYFTFKLTDNKTEFNYYGKYELELEVVSGGHIDTNYEILNSTSNEYNIDKLEVNITINDLTKTYNETILQSDFSTDEIELAGNDHLANVAELIYTIDENAEIGVLDVGTYTINISFAAKTLYTNYNFIVDTATLTIIKRDTELRAENIEKFYDTEKTFITAEIFGLDNAPISSDSITYKYYKKIATETEQIQKQSPVKLFSMMPRYAAQPDEIECDELGALGVGEYRVEAHYAGDNNNNPCTVSFSILIKESIITIDDSALTVTYNGLNYVPSYTYKINGEETTIDLEEKAGLTYSLLDLGKNPEDSIKNAGDYFIKFSITDANFKFEENRDEFAFSINKAKITDITMQGSYIYSKAEPKFVYTNFAGLITNETIIVSDYAIKKDVVTPTTFDVGSYKLYIKEITADNYELAEELTKDFTITAREIAITIDNKTSIYGEAIDLENLSYTVTSELKVCEGDNLGLVAEESTIEALAGRPTVQDYDLEAEATNTNYAVTVTKGTYSITQRKVTIEYVEDNFIYNGANQFDCIKNPTINTPVTGDEDYFTFQLADNKTEFKDFGAYVLELVSNNYIETNYEILSETSKDYNIKKFEISITANDLEKTYNQQITANEFSFKNDTLAGTDNINNVVSVSYEVWKGDVKCDYETDVLAVYSSYEIRLVLTAGTLYSNYDITPVSGTLKIIMRNTELRAENIEKYYDMQSVSLVAKLYGADGFEIENPTLTYTYYKNNSSTAEANSFAKDVGFYTVYVEAEADENNDACSAKFYITIKESVITIDDSTLTVIYNGQNYVPSYTYKINGEETTIDLEERAGLTYSLLDSGKNLKETIKNAGDYFIKFSITDANFKFEENKDEFAFSINKAKITDITMQGSYVYCKGQPEFVYTNFAGLITNETIIVSDYAIKKDVVTPTTFDVGSYTLYIKEITADNYELAEELTKDFTITAREIAITLDNKSSVYGEAIDLENLSYTVTSELKVCEGDNLGLVAEESTVAALAGRPTVQDYDLEAEATNTNYAVTVTKGIYSITQRKVTIEYVEDNFTYNGEDQLSSIINPTIDNIAEGEESYFTFKLTDNKTEFKYYGKYELELEVVSGGHIDTNYEMLNATSNEYNIDKLEVKITINDLTKTYNETINQEDFSINYIESAMPDKLEDVAEITFKVVGEEDINGLVVVEGGYEIYIEFTAKKLYENYDFKVTTGTLTINKRDTELRAENIEKFYDTEKTFITAEIFGLDNAPISSDSITYKYYKKIATETEQIQKQSPVKLFSMMPRYAAQPDEIECEELGALGVGEYRVEAHYAGDNNNNPCTVSFSILIKESIITIDDSALTVTYNGLNYVPSYTYKINGEETTIDLEEKAGLTYSLLDLGKNLKETIKNAGDYFIKFSITDSNFKFEENKEEFAFSINKAKITDITMQGSYIYSKAEPKFVYTNFAGLITNETITVSDYDIKKGGVTPTTFDVGSYTLYIKEITADNYELAEELTKDFTITAREIAITLDNKSSVYGDAIDLENLSYTVTSELKVCEGDNLGLVAEESTVAALAGRSTVQDYDLEAEATNANYAVTVTKGTYSITQRKVTIEYVEDNFTYNGEDQLSSIVNPTIDNIAEGEESYFTFKLAENKTEFKYYGKYELELEVVSGGHIDTNYEILNATSNEYNIDKLEVKITINDLTKTYNETINQEDFSINDIESAMPDDLANVAEITFKVVGEEDINGLVVVEGGYEIYIEFTAKKLYENYDFKVTTATLTIIKRNTELRAEDIEKFYDLQSVSLVAKLYGADGVEIENPTLTYEYFKNSSKTPETNKYAKDVGYYSVYVEAMADENNEGCYAYFDIIINPSIITMHSSNLNVTYNGEDYVPSYSYEINGGKTTINLEDEKILSYTLLDVNKNAIESIKNADDYKIVFDVSDNNFSIEETTKEFDIKINPIEIKVKVFDRAIQYKDEFNIQDSSYEIIEGSVLEGESLSITYKIEDYLGVYGSYSLTLENHNSNYNVIVETKGNFVVNKRELVIKYSGSDDLTYNKEGQNELLSATVENAKEEGVYSIYYLKGNGQIATSVVNAGEYTLCIRINDSTNYKFKDYDTNLVSKSINIAVQKHILTLTLNNKVYDGESIDECEIKSSYTGFNTDLYTINYYKGGVLLTSVPVDAGDYRIEIIEKDKNNYKFENNIKEFKIETKELTIEPIQFEYSYNKTPIKPTLKLKGVVGLDNVKLSVTYESDTGEFIKVDDYKIIINGLTGTKANNYKLDSTEPIDYKIIPTIVNVSSFNNKFTFTNYQLNASELGIRFDSNLVNTLDYEVSNLPKFFGEHDVIVSSKNPGLAFGVKNGVYQYDTTIKIMINKATIMDINFNGNTVTYDNKAHSLQIDNLTLANGIVLAVEYSENSFVNAGNHEVFATLTNDNYETLVLKANLVIEQAVINVDILSSSDYTYNQSAQGDEILDLDTLWYKDLILFKYVGENYDSREKPICAGDYKLVISPIDGNNIHINNVENEFKIKTKEISLKTLTNQSAIYSKTQVEYVFEYIGKVEGDEVSVNVLYNDLNECPVNAGEYNITFNKLIGVDSNNYHLKQATIVPTLIISPKDITVTAHNKEIIYGEADVDLTCDFAELYTGDEYSGQITREQGSNVNSYKILIGSLSAGDNYNIKFKDAIYSIKQRPITTNSFQKSFIYNGKTQIPDILLHNTLLKDGNVVSVLTEGDTINAGEYTLKLVLENYNYKFNCDSEYIISINKKDVSEKIIGLVSTEKDYDGNKVIPIVLIDGDYNYEVNYTIEEVEVNQILNAGTYQVRVNILDNNYCGEGTFNYVVKKISYDEKVIENLKYDISSTSIILSNIENISVSVNEENFSIGNVVSNLNENTSYNVFIKIHASENYKETIFDIGKVTTSKSALKINSKIDVILENSIQSFEIAKIKEILLDCESLSSIEKTILDNNKIEDLKEKYQEYVDTINRDVNQVKIASNLVDHSEEKTIKTISFTASIIMIGACIMIVKGKKKDEIED